ncbi:MAG TPA: hypothetical protein EYO33_22760 [Phycisphaerales bacterium]|nr:hypothetical protein [Phycisphaerales bacterium]
MENRKNDTFRFLESDEKFWARYSERLEQLDRTMERREAERPPEPEIEKKRLRPTEDFRLFGRKVA